MEKLTNALNTFGSVKQSGANGEKLAIDVLHVYNTITDITTSFEAGSQDEAWVSSLINMAGVDTLEYATNVYLVLKETQEKLEKLDK